MSVSSFLLDQFIYLAPNIPEGLGMFFHANKITGDYEIINGLNHYIGMKSTSEDFGNLNFYLMLLGFFAALAFLHRIPLNNKKWFYFFAALFLYIWVAGSW